MLNRPRVLISLVDRDLRLRAGISRTAWWVRQCGGDVQVPVETNAPETERLHTECHRDNLTPGSVSLLCPSSTINSSSDDRPVRREHHTPLECGQTCGLPSTGKVVLWATLETIVRGLVIQDTLRGREFEPCPGKGPFFAISAILDSDRIGG